MRLEEFVADHARKMEAEKVLPGKWPVVEPRDVLFLHLPERKAMHDIGHDLQRPAAARPYRGLVFLELDPGFLDDRLSQLDTSFSEPRVDEQKCCRKRLHATPPHHEMVACNPER